MTSTPEHTEVRHRQGAAAIGPALLLVPIVAALLVRGRVSLFDDEAIRLWSTLFVSICIQALPFLTLGVVVSGVLAAFVPATAVQRLVPKRPMIAVPVAGMAGMALPGCECGSVPIAGRLIAGGVPPAAALTFLLSAPAINPVVLVSTAVAFPNDHIMVLARFLASLFTAILVGLWWAHRPDTGLLEGVDRHDHHGQHHRVATFIDVASRDFVHAGGYLVVGALAAATLQLVVPRSVLDSVAGNEIAATLAMAVLALVLSVCSEADAFVAAGLPQFSLSSRLVFLVVGPVVDLKLVAMQSGVFGRRFAAVFAPTCFIVAIACAVVVARSLL